MELIDLTGNNVILTGASRGLGEQIARSMWQRGASLFLVARSESTLSQLKSELVSFSSAKQEIHIFKADLAAPSAPNTIISKAREVWKKIDVLVNNAAVPGPIGKLWENSWNEWEIALQVNLLATVALCRYTIPWMIEYCQGKIINLSGGGATSPRPNFSAYGTAKAALVRFSEILAHEVKEYNIQVNCISPGAMNTAMLEAVRKAGPEKAGKTEFAKAIECHSDESGLYRRAVELCCFLASPASKGITGKLISAVWDPWESLSEHLEDFNNSDIYTLRRILPKDRGLCWDER
jgi:3-oxoacyl-[acyl-carrier protein] reductase